MKLLMFLFALLAADFSFANDYQCEMLFHPHPYANDQELNNTLLRAVGSVSGGFQSYESRDGNRVFMIRDGKRTNSQMSPDQIAAFDDLATKLNFISGQLPEEGLTDDQKGLNDGVLLKYFNESQKFKIPGDPEDEGRFEQFARSQIEARKYLRGNLWRLAAGAGFLGATWVTIPPVMSGYTVNGILGGVMSVVGLETLSTIRQYRKTKNKISVLRFKFIVDFLSRVDAVTIKNRSKNTFVVVPSAFFDLWEDHMAVVGFHRTHFDFDTKTFQAAPP